jgi:hypothetical protein
MSHTQASQIVIKPAERLAIDGFSYTDDPRWQDPNSHDPESFAIAITVIVALHVVVWILDGAGVLS